MRIKRILIGNLYILATSILTKTASANHGGIHGTQGTIDIGNTDKVGELPNPLKIESIEGLIDRVMTALYFIIPPIAVLMVIIGAFQILTAAGSEEKFKTGKRTITYAVIGIAIFLLADLVIGLITELLGAEEPSL